MIRKLTTATYILLTCTTVSLGSRQIGHIKCAKKTLCIGHKQKQIYLYLLRTEQKKYYSIQSFFLKRIFCFSIFGGKINL